MLQNLQQILELQKNVKVPELSLLAKHNEWFQSYISLQKDGRCQSYLSSTGEKIVPYLSSTGEKIVPSRDTRDCLTHSLLLRAPTPEQELLQVL